VLPGANGELSALEDDQFIRVKPSYLIRRHQFAVGIGSTPPDAFAFSTLVLRLVFNQDCGLTQQFAEILLCSRIIRSKQKPGITRINDFRRYLFSISVFKLAFALENQKGGNPITPHRRDLAP